MFGKKRFIQNSVDEADDQLMLLFVFKNRPSFWSCSRQVTADILFMKKPAGRAAFTAAKLPNYTNGGARLCLLPPCWCWQSPRWWKCVGETKVKKTNGSVDTKAATALIYWSACGEQASIMQQKLRTNLRLHVWSTLTVMVVPAGAGGAEGGRRSGWSVKCQRSRWKGLMRMSQTHQCLTWLQWNQKRRS